MSQVLAALEEDECYLWAILSDTSGLDIAEFCIEEPMNDDLIWRAWPFQWGWFRTDDPRQIEQGSRSSGKSVSVKLRCIAFPFSYPGAQMVLAAPEGNHLDLLTDKVETAFYSNKLLREMLVKGRTGITHKPFGVAFQNGAHIDGRIPQRDGRGFKGIHPLILEIDEAQDLTDKAWNEVKEVLLRGNEAARWRCHGVTRGLRDHFYKFTQPGSGWTVHRYPAMCRPTWTDEEREEKIREYGSWDSPDYKRNVLGLHGDSTSHLVVLSRLVLCADRDEDSKYNTTEYCLLEIDDGMIRENNGSILQLLDLPAIHGKYDDIWIGMDVGFTVDPSVIVVFAEEKTNASKPSRLKLLARIILKRVKHEDQAQAIVHLIDLYRPKAFAMDRTGLGLPVFQDVQHRVREDKDLAFVIDRIKGYNFSEKIIVGFDDSMEGVVDSSDPQSMLKREIKKNVLEYSSDLVRMMVDEERLLLPNDMDLLDEFRGQTWTFSPGGGGGGRRIFSSGNFHSLDATRMALLGFHQHLVDSEIKNQEVRFTPVETVFLY